MRRQEELSKDPFLETSALLLIKEDGFADSDIRLKRSEKDVFEKKSFKKTVV